jgi:hypothetical protein
MSFTSATVSSMLRKLVSRIRSVPEVSLGRPIWPMPAASTVAAFSGAKLPSAPNSARFPVQMQRICAAFSSSVMRESRSWTRAAMGARALR